MNLSDFQIKIENPWNDMDEEEGKKFQERRDKQVKNWRDVVYKNIELSPPGTGEVTRIPDDHFQAGKLDGKEKTGCYCDKCGAVLDSKSKCFYCNEIDTEEKDEKVSKKEEKAAKKQKK